MRAIPATLVLPLLLSVAATGSSGPGTEFWAVLSEDEGHSYDLSVYVGNPDPARSASVQVETEAGPVASASVLPLSTHEFRLGYGRRVAGSARIRSAYRISSDLPVHAYQYLSDLSISGSSSGALLLDRDALGREYIALALPGNDVQYRYSTVTVVAPGPARVTVAPTAPTQAGNGVPALTAGSPHTADLEAFDVLQLAGAVGADLTGTSVVSDAPVEVFSGCTFCTLRDSGADHVQEVMFPVPWWSTAAVAAATNPLTSDINVWRILAARDGTDVVTEPSKPGTPVTLGRGQFVELESTEDFAVTASQPVLVARFNTLGDFRREPDPDPAMCLMLPPDRFLTSAVFRLPSRTGLNNWLDVVARPGTTVTVDGVVVPETSFLPIGASGFLHAQLRVSEATPDHRIEASQPVAAYAANGQAANGASFPVGTGAPLDLAPVCDPGGPYAAACSGPATEVGLDATASRDPEGQPLAFRWSSASPAVSFDDPTSPVPTATITGLGPVTVDLEVTDGTNLATCSADVTLTGDPVVPPELSRGVTPLWAARRGAEVLFSWQDLGGAPVGYNVYQGRLKDFYSETPLVCQLAGAPEPAGRRQATLTPGPGSVYFFISAANCAGEGPSGGDPLLQSCPP